MDVLPTTNEARVLQDLLFLCLWRTVQEGLENDSQDWSPGWVATSPEQI